MGKMTQARMWLNALMAHNVKKPPSNNVIMQREHKNIWAVIFTDKSLLWWNYKARSGHASEVEEGIDYNSALETIINRPPL